MTTIISTIRKPDGALVRVETDGRARPVVQKPLRPMTQAFFRNGLKPGANTASLEPMANCASWIRSAR